MKNILLTFGFFLSIILLNSCIKAETSFHEEARCTGSSSCSACSNCSRCAHCSSGGSCGVCRGNSSGRSFYSVPKKHKKSYSSSDNYKKSSTSKKSYYSANGLKTKPVVVNFYNSGNLVNVSSVGKTTNLRKTPSLKAPVIEKISKGASVKILENRKGWRKVKVVRSGNVGYIYSGNVK